MSEVMRRWTGGWRGRLAAGLLLLLVPAPVATLTRVPGAAPSPRPGAAGVCASEAPRDEATWLLAQVGTPANACCTPHVSCPLSAPAVVGTACTCSSAYGPVAGTACRL
jgi:hypothetical protein